MTIESLARAQKVSSDDEANQEQPRCRSFSASRGRSLVLPLSGESKRALQPRAWVRRSAGELQKGPREEAKARPLGETRAERTIQRPCADSPMEAESLARFEAAGVPVHLFKLKESELQVRPDGMPALLFIGK